MRKYNEKAAEVIIEELSTTTKGLHRICKDIGISTRTVYDWIIEDYESFGQKYTRAKQLQAEIALEEAYDIADDSSGDLKAIDDHGNRIEDREFINRSRLRVDLRKWHASKLAPKVYGDRLELAGAVETKQALNTEALQAIADRIAGNASKPKDTE